jgi:hypothetical protein
MFLRFKIFVVARLFGTFTYVWWLSWVRVRVRRIEWKSISVSMDWIEMKWILSSLIKIFLGISLIQYYDHLNITISK